MTGNPGSTTALQLRVYGPSLTGRIHINGFNLSTGRVYPIYSPKTKRKILAHTARAGLTMHTEREELGK
ncbi:MAG: hypothetical protein NT072_00285 [Deltaproteobacteria bacterium]|nr:hypothetical protein [Deltaproteobacteria bacterium]